VGPEAGIFCTGAEGKVIYRRGEKGAEGKEKGKGAPRTLGEQTLKTLRDAEKVSWEVATVEGGVTRKGKFLS